MFLILIREDVNTMNTKFSKALLMSGKDFRLTDSITLRHPTVKDILSINSTPSPDLLYWMYIQILLSDPYSNMVMLDDIGKNYLNISPYEVFTLQWENSERTYCANKDLYNFYGENPLENIQGALQFFIAGNHVFKKGVYDNGEICFYDENDKSCQINSEIFEYIYEWVKLINKIDFSNQIKPADENARRILIQDMRDELKKAKRRNKQHKVNANYLGDIMSAISFCGNGSITPFNIYDCKIYWLNECLSISNKKNHADHILDGIYHGAISSKNINKNDINWIQ